MNFKNFPTLKTNEGFIALITILVITAVSLIIATSIIFKSISQGNITLAEMYSTQAMVAANGCMEHALGELGANGTTSWSLSLGVGYTGAEQRTIGSNTCYIYPLAATTSGVYTDYRLVKASSTVSGYTRKIQAVVATNTPTISVSSWQDVGDFTN
jgi:hypothetical protein